MRSRHLDHLRRRSPSGLIRILATLVLLAGGELSAQTGATERPSGVEQIAVEVFTPIDHALERGILASHLPEGAPNTVIALDNPLLLLIKRNPSALLFDNNNNRYTGAYRISGSLNLVNPIGLNDTFSAHAFGTDERFLVRRLAYLVPVGRYGTRIGASYLDFDYQLAKDFASLKANGDGKVSSLHALQPIVESGAVNVILSYTHERKELVDRVDTIASITNRVVDSDRVAVIGHLRDDVFGGGLNAVSIAATSGDLRIGPAAVLAADQAATGFKTQGGFQRYQYSFQRLQRITSNASLSLSIFGQTASKNLGSSEKFVLGGAAGVRAYPTGEALGDSGFVFIGEFRYLIPGSDILGAKVALTGFYDMGRVKVNENPPTALAITNRRSIAGYGVGVHAGNASDFVVRASVAWRAENEVPQSDTAKRIPRVWFQAIKWF